MKLSDGIQGSCYFYWVYNDLDDLLLKKEKEPLPAKPCWAVGLQRSTTALESVSTQQDA